MFINDVPKSIFDCSKDNEIVSELNPFDSGFLSYTKATENGTVFGWRGDYDKEQQPGNIEEPDSLLFQWHLDYY